MSSKDDKPNEPKTYRVGYGRPPEETRFQKGRSGNPRGRPKGAVSLRSALRTEMAQKVPITENGKHMMVSKRQVIVKSLADKAMKGNVAAARELLTMNLSLLGAGEEDQRKAALSDNDAAIVDRVLNFGTPNAVEPESAIGTNRDGGDSSDDGDGVAGD